jgi:hypothetical protein
MDEQHNAKLKELADEINREVDWMAGALEHAMRAGDLLARAKELAGHGGWEIWLKANCRISGRTARRYMQLAKNRPYLADLETETEALARLELVAPLNDADRVDWLGRAVENHWDADRLRRELGLEWTAPDVDAGGDEFPDPEAGREACSCQCPTCGGTGRFQWES